MFYCHSSFFVALNYGTTNCYFQSLLYIVSDEGSEVTDHPLLESDSRARWGIFCKVATTLEIQSPPLKM